MKYLLLITAVCFCFQSYAQKGALLLPDQNPNYEITLQKYLASDDTYILNQGTTSQETYVAIDPLEEKRLRKKAKRDYRAQKRLWRHQRALERAKNTTYVYDPYDVSYSRWSGMNVLSWTLFGSCLLF